MSRVAATSSYTVGFRHRAAPVAAQQPSGRIPRVSRLLALAHRIDSRIRSGELRDLAHAARLCGVTRPRMTQIMNLLLLAPEIQQAILTWPPVTKGRDPITERHLRAIVAEPDWSRQRTLWQELQSRPTPDFPPSVERAQPQAAAVRGGR